MWGYDRANIDVAKLRDLLEKKSVRIAELEKESHAALVQACERGAQVEKLEAQLAEARKDKDLLDSGAIRLYDPSEFSDYSTWTNVNLRDAIADAAMEPK